MSEEDPFSLGEVDRIRGRMKSDNPKFAYPGPMFQTPNGPMLIQRGYLRMLSELYDITSGPSTGRLWFQFNPTMLTRSVSAASDVQMWINMDPSQMMVPRPGNMNFTFQLLFNREAEVMGNPLSSSMARSRDYLAILKEIMAADADLDMGEWTSELGVLVDIVMLDNIVGQGLSSTLINKILEAQDPNLLNGTSTATTTDTGADTGATDEQTGDTVPITTEDLRNLFTTNVGNSAFLASQPVRVVFSKLFMVDGFVQNVTVTFTKFTRGLIPTMASVDITMNALYIGFTRKDTALTYYWRDRDRTAALQPSFTTDTSNPLNAVYTGALEIMNRTVTRDGGFFTRVVWGDVSRDPVTMRAADIVAESFEINDFSTVDGSSALQENYLFTLDGIDLTYIVGKDTLTTSAYAAQHQLTFNSTLTMDIAWRERGTYGAWTKFGDTSTSIRPIETTTSTFVLDRTEPITRGTVANTSGERVLALNNRHLSSGHTLTFMAPLNFTHISSGKRRLKFDNVIINGATKDIEVRVTLKANFDVNVSGATIVGSSILRNFTVTSGTADIKFDNTISSGSYRAPLQDNS